MDFRFISSPLVLPLGSTLAEAHQRGPLEGQRAGIRHRRRDRKAFLPTDYYSRVIATDATGTSTGLVPSFRTNPYFFAITPERLLAESRREPL